MVITMITSNLKYIMEKEGVSINKLMEMTGISSHTIHRIRSSAAIKTCTLKTLEKIAAALNCSPKQLFEYEKDREYTKAHKY
jgi:DNA-binding Xre family transcriptional regulator